MGSVEGVSDVTGCYGLFEHGVYGSGYLEVFVALSQGGCEVFVGGFGLFRFGFGIGFRFEGAGWILFVMDMSIGSVVNDCFICISNNLRWKIILSLMSATIIINSSVIVIVKRKENLVSNLRRTNTLIMNHRRQAKGAQTQFIPLDQLLQLFQLILQLTGHHPSLRAPRVTHRTLVRNVPLGIVALTAPQGSAVMSVDSV